MSPLHVPPWTVRLCIVRDSGRYLQPLTSVHRERKKQEKEAAARAKQEEEERAKKEEEERQRAEEEAAAQTRAADKKNREKERKMLQKERKKLRQALTCFAFITLAYTPQSLQTCPCSCLLLIKASSVVFVTRPVSLPLFAPLCSHAELALSPTQRSWVSFDVWQSALPPALASQLLAGASVDPACLSSPASSVRATSGSFKKIDDFNVEKLCSSLSFSDLQSLNTSLESVTDEADAMALIDSHLGSLTQSADDKEKARAGALAAEIEVCPTVAFSAPCLQFPPDPPPPPPVLCTSSAISIWS